MCSKMAKGIPSARIGLALKRVHSVRMGIVNRIIIPKACALSSFTSMFRTLCHTNNIGPVNDLHDVGIVHGKGAVTSLSICSLLVGKGVGSSVHLRSNSMVLISPCRSLMRVLNGMGHPVFCRVGPARAMNALLGCSNNFANSTCGGTLHVVHGDKHRRRVCGISRVSCSMFHMSSNSGVAISSILRHFRGHIRIHNTMCHRNLCRLSNVVGAIGRLVGGTRKLHKSTFLGHTVVSHRLRSLSRRVVRMSIGNLLGKATTSVPLRGGSVLCVPDVRSLGRRTALAVRNRITGPNACLCSSGVAMRSLILRTNNLLRTTTAAGIRITQHVGSPGDASFDAAMNRGFSFSLGSNLLIKRKDRSFRLRPFSRVCIHGDPSCFGRRGIVINKRILFDNGCTLSGGGRHLDSLVTGTNKMAPSTCVGKTHLVHEVARRRFHHGRSTLHVTRTKNKSSVSMGELSLSSACSMNVGLKRTLGGPNSSTSVILHRKSMLFIPRCMDAIGVGNTMVCPGAILCGGNRDLGCCVGRTNNFNGSTGGHGICMVCVGNAISHLGTKGGGTVRPNYRVVIPDGRRGGGVAATRVLKVKDAATSVTTVVTAVIGLFGWFRL